MSIDDDGTTETIQAEDVEAYMDKQRLKSLFEARNEAARATRDASLNRIKAQERGASPSLAQKIVSERIASCVRAYIAECEPLLRNTETGRQLMYQEEISRSRFLSVRTASRFMKLSLSRPASSMTAR